LALKNALNSLTAVFARPEPVAEVGAAVKGFWTRLFADFTKFSANPVQLLGSGIQAVGQCGAASALARDKLNKFGLSPIKQSVNLITRLTQAKNCLLCRINRCRFGAEYFTAERLDPLNQGLGASKISRKRTAADPIGADSSARQIPDCQLIKAKPFTQIGVNREAEINSSELKISNSQPGNRCSNSIRESSV